MHSRLSPVLAAMILRAGGEAAETKREDQMKPHAESPATGGPAKDLRKAVGVVPVVL
jgi:hypothetical protein